MTRDDEEETHMKVLLSAHTIGAVARGAWEAGVEVVAASSGALRKILGC